MSDEKKKTKNEDLFLADFEAYRTGEEHDDPSITPMDSRAMEDLDRISKIFIEARPDTGEIPESVDNIVLGHIKEKSRKIRRDRKVVRLFPRYKWAAAAVMGVLICAVSFNLVYKMDKPSNDPISFQIAKDIDGNGRVNIIDAYIMDRRLMSGAAMPKKLDLNGDGNINYEDINAIVKTAVSLGRGEV